MSSKEPVFNIDLPKEEWSTHMARVLRWYSVNDSSKVTKTTARNYLIDWVAANRPEDLIAIQQANPKLILNTWGWVARIVTLQPLAPNCTQFLNKVITEFLKNEGKKRTDNIKQISPTGNAELENIMKIVYDELAEIKRKLLDSKKDVDSDLDVYVVLKEHNIKVPEAREFLTIIERDQLTVSNLKNNYDAEKANTEGFTSKARVAIYSAIMYKYTQGARKYFNEVKKTVIQR